MKVFFIMVFLFCLVLSGVTYAEEIRVEGGGTSINAVFMPMKTAFEKVSGDTLNIVQSSSIKGLTALQDGKVDVAASAHSLSDVIAAAAKEGVTIDGTKMVATQVEDNRLVVIVNRANVVKALTQDQLKDVFSGKITNWKQVGGRDLDIDVIWGKETKGQNVQFTRVALQGVPVTLKAREATDYKNILKLVTEMPTAIGVVPLQISTAVIRTVDTLPIVSPIYAFTNGAPSKKVQQVLDFYKKEFSYE